MIERKKITGQIAEALKLTPKQQIQIAERFERPRLPVIHFDTELAKYICEQIASGRPLSVICKDPGMPHFQAVMQWQLNNVQGFTKMIREARIIAAELLVDEIKGIADDSSRDYTIDEEGNPALQKEHIKRAEVRIKARQWIASKVLPKIYGDAATIKLADSDGNTLPSQAPLLVIQPVTAEKG